MELIIIGTGLFWAALIIPFLLITIAISVEWFGAATLIGFITIVILSFFSNLHWANLLSWWTLLYIGGYIVTGIVWALWKWYVYCKDQLKLYNEKKDKWQTEYNNQDVNKRIGQTFSQYVKRWYDIPPSITTHKEEFIENMAFWPWIMVITFFGDYILRFCRMIYRRLATTLERIRDKVFAGSGLTG